MKQLAFRLLSCRLAWAALLICLLMPSFASRASAQTSDDVHIVPSDRTPDAALKERGSATDFYPRLDSSLFSVDVDLVLVPVVVTDGMNRPVTGLSKDNFVLYEDQKSQDILYFSTEDAPISIGIVLDLSGSMSNKIDAAREALKEFFKNSHPDDDYFVITFADRPQLLAGSTQSIGDIEGKLATVKPFGHTALLDAIHMGLVELRSARYKRRALLIISDGEDNCSHHNLREIKSMVEESGVEVYAIGIFDDGLPILKSIDEELGKRILTQVTEASGGRTLTARNLAKLPQVAATISLDMRSQYLLGYRPPKAIHKRKWRKIKVLVATAIAATHHSVRLHPSYKTGYMAALP